MNHQEHIAGIESMPIDAVFLLSLRKPDAFAEIVRRLQAPFLRKAVAVLKNKDNAYDVVQETFVRMYASARKYRVLEGASFNSWAYKILMNQCFTLLSKNQKISLHELHLDEEWHEYIADMDESNLAEQKLTKDYVMSLVSRLPFVFRRIVSLHYIEDIPQQEIAIREGLTYEVVRTRLARAKAMLKKFL